jgi:hypothetical protein
MATTYTLIGSNTLTAEANYFTFSSIPQTYSDLVLMVGGSNTANDYGGFYIRFNGTDYSSTMTGRRIRYSGSGAQTDNSKEASWPLLQYSTTSAKSFTEYYIPNYSTSSTPKSASFYGGSPNQTYALYNNVWWSGTNAITTIDVGIFDAASNKFTIGSSAYLYGISNT